jgi:hypothetical protein
VRARRAARFDGNGKEYVMRKLTMIGLLCGLCLVGGPGEAAAQNCPPNDGTLKINPLKVCFEDPSRANPLSSPTTYEIGYFLPGASQPFQPPTSVPLATATTIAGTTPVSYQVLYTALTAYPAGQQFEVRVRGINSSGTTAWSNATDFFGQRSTPSAPVQVRLGS